MYIFSRRKRQKKKKKGHTVASKARDKEESFTRRDLEGARDSVDIALGSKIVHEVGARVRVLVASVDDSTKLAGGIEDGIAGLCVNK